MTATHAPVQDSDPMTPRREWPPHSRWRLRRSADRLIHRAARAAAALDVLAGTGALPVRRTGPLHRWSARRRIRRVRRVLHRHEAAWQDLLDRYGLVVRLLPPGPGADDARAGLVGILAGDEPAPAASWLRPSSQLDQALLPALQALAAHHPAVLEARLQDLLRKPAARPHHRDPQLAGRGERNPTLLEEE